MKIKLLIITIIGSVLLTGCIQPPFDRNNKGIQFVAGMPYSIPYSVKYTETLAKGKKASLVLKSIGIDCGNNPIVWTTDQNNFSTEAAAIEAIRQGKVGCSSPLNNKEYQYMLNQQNQQSANARVMSQNTAAMMPKTYNVNHTGTMYHYGY